MSVKVVFLEPSDGYSSRFREIHVVKAFYGKNGRGREVIWIFIIRLWALDFLESETGNWGKMQCAEYANALS